MKELETEIEYLMFSKYHPTVIINTWLDDNKRSWMRLTFIAEVDTHKPQKYWSVSKNAGYYRKGGEPYCIMNWKMFE